MWTLKKEVSLKKIGRNGVAILGYGFDRMPTDFLWISMPARMRQALYPGIAFLETVIKRSHAVLTGTAVSRCEFSDRGVLRRPAARPGSSERSRPRGHHSGRRWVHWLFGWQVPSAAWCGYRWSLTVALLLLLSSAESGSYGAPVAVPASRAMSTAFSGIPQEFPENRNVA